MSIKLKDKLSVLKINLVIDCADAGILADFYNKLLGWEWTHPRANGWAAITSPNGTVIAFQEIEDYQPPIWPHQKGKQGQMLHLDIYVEDLEEAVQFAVECGAKVADEQYFRTSRTMIDPAGHPFCLDTDESE
ncbi:putative enzyme related to lactoylglutathione lyase [Dysgonomonas sp. PFB1-18]|uniref:VOC family protein n=1 Tax=unclassified Dysgonomonas TaxID=2630389 RepID=UPI002472EA8B|nr:MULTISPECIES: VOC family protein [unclassified Dysgonomonas]MDH6309299.1 putative enzyme related to lactoylglutathione lyase [Dysgonomonas sp. PF1-14]MDH6339836.1 putative enzyme related to lactoylglutathione lyase [Dysgonomonas sp. PF1-16]MDH6381484.1 putative enzyme related to lactoylglutathione lyase [Dysgonomonas sp. PFB1-18]MDH6398699.1 putative enzyme related to lactoylglutathione lyase [Dysgonomonas sp. PF1-23]